MRPSPNPPHLYVVSDRRLAGDLIAVITAIVHAVPPGAAAVQLREKDLDARTLCALARRLLDVCRPRRCPLLVNDRLDVALAVGADGVHLPEYGLDVATVRQLAGPDLLIGASTHSAERASSRLREGADLVVLGPIWTTPSKARYGDPLGPDALRQSARPAPALFAIGGIEGPDRAREAIQAGADGVAAIRAFMADPDPGGAARAFHDAIIKRA